MPGKFIYKVVDKYTPSVIEIQNLLNSMSIDGWEYINTVTRSTSDYINFVFRKFIPNNVNNSEII